MSWLNETGYEPYGFNRTEFFGGSFGGKETEEDTVTRDPVIFIHGNADMIIGDTPMNNGFRYSIEYFLSRGYKKSELYGSQYGYADVPHEPEHMLLKEYVHQIRTFVEAVLEYTGAKQVNIVAHS